MDIGPRIPAAAGWWRVINGQTYWFLPDDDGVLVYRYTGNEWGRWEVVHAL